MKIGDHPPITPTTKVARSPASVVKECGHQDGWRLYQFICRTFVASFSDDAYFDTVETNFDIGGESFVTSVTVCTKRGWMSPLSAPMFSHDAQEEAAQEVLARRRYASLAALAKGTLVTFASKIDAEGELELEPFLEPHWTTPPPHLTEGDLLGLMEQHGIGTDASMATHIGNIVKRGYVILDPDT